MFKVPLFFRHPIFTAIGALVPGIACSFISDYSITQVWETTHVNFLIVKFFAILLACPWTYVVLSAILIILNCYASYESTKALEKENQNLKVNLNDKILEVSNLESDNKRLNSQKNAYQENIEQLNSEISELQNRISTGWLKNVFKNNDFSTSERITIYFELNNEFNLLSRYSSNPSYNNKHRQKFPVNQGVISRAWREGQWVEDKCPVHNPKNMAYKQYMSKTYSFSPKDIENFAMKSCWYVAVAISKADDNIGVIVFESTVQNRLNHTDVCRLIDYCNSEKTHLIQFIEESKALDTAKHMESTNIPRDTDQDILSSMNGGF